MLSLILLLMESLSWLAPLAVSTLTGGVAGYGSFRFGQGQLLERVASLERSSIHVTEERGQLVTRHEFEMLREDIRDIKADIRELMKR